MYGTPVPILYNGSPLAPQNCPFTWGIWTPLNTWLLGQPTRVHDSKGISIGSTVFTGLTTVTDRPTDIPATSSVVIASRLHTYYSDAALVTSGPGQSNLTTGRIAAAHGRFSGIRQVALECTPPNTCFLVPIPESKSQTASRSIQPFFQGSLL